MFDQPDKIQDRKVNERLQRRFFESLALSKFSLSINTQIFHFFFTRLKQE